MEKSIISLEDSLDSVFGLSSKDLEAVFPADAGISGGCSL